MFDETIQRSARRARIMPIHFEHPIQDELLSCFDRRTTDPVSVVLTGTAGDGKTHLCRQVWEMLKGDPKAWASDDSYLCLKSLYPKDRRHWPETEDSNLYRQITIHFIRDLSGWAPQQGLTWEPEKEALLQKLCQALYNPDSTEIFLIAANDGILIESWRRLHDTEYVIRARKLFEDLLVEERQQEAGARLKMFNLSRVNSDELFERAYEAFINHPGWASCYTGLQGEDQFFGQKCPIRHNYELLKIPRVRHRLNALIELCDSNGLHLPIRQILLMLSNAILGHPDCEDHLMKSSDVPKIIKEGTISKASLYNNIFGGNLSETRRHGIAIFDCFERFQIGHETSNKIDNILIFGEDDPDLGKYFTALLQDDPFYGADSQYFAVKNRYIEGAEDDSGASREFLDLLTAKRRGLFFKISDNEADKLNLWDLTVFRFAGQYIFEVLDVLRNGHSVKRPLTGRLVKGLNRIFTGMLVNSERELLLATSGNYSQAKISRVLADKISVEPRHGECVRLELTAAGRVSLAVSLNKQITELLELNLVRFEFLSRVATEGALPASFSKECYEDILSFKSRLLSAHQKRREIDGEHNDNDLGIRVLTISGAGLPEDRFVEVIS